MRKWEGEQKSHRTPAVSINLVAADVRRLILFRLREVRAFEVPPRRWKSRLAGTLAPLGEEGIRRRLGRFIRFSSGHCGDHAEAVAPGKAKVDGFDLVSERRAFTVSP